MVVFGTSGNQIYFLFFVVFLVLKIWKEDFSFLVHGWGRTTLEICGSIQRITACNLRYRVVTLLEIFWLFKSKHVIELWYASISCLVSLNNRISTWPHIYELINLYLTCLSATSPEPVHICISSVPHILTWSVIFHPSA